MAKKNQIDIKVKYVPDTGALEAANKAIKNLKVPAGGELGKSTENIQNMFNKLTTSLESGASTQTITKNFKNVEKALSRAAVEAKQMASQMNTAFSSAGNQKLLKDLDNARGKIEKAKLALNKWDASYGKNETNRRQKDLEKAGIDGGSRGVNKVINTYEKSLKNNIAITEELEKQYKLAKETRAFLDEKRANPKGGLEADLKLAKREENEILSRGIILPEVNIESTKAAKAYTDNTDFIKLQLDETLEDVENFTKKEAELYKERDAKLNKLTDIAAGTFLGTSLSNLAEDALREGIQFFKEYDEILTRTMMVTGMTRTEVNGLTEAYGDLASSLNSTIKDVAAAQLVFYQQGLGTQEALAMTEASIAVSKTGGIAAEEAANRLTSAVKGYQLAASDAMNIADKMSALDAAAASSVDELTVAMQKSASQARMAGLDLDYYMAYLSTMQEVTREAPENIGTAMKSITARLQEITDIGKVEEDGTTFNNVAKALNSIGIAAVDSSGQLRPLQQIFDELGPQWETLDRNHKSYIATVLAGNRQQSRFIALMDNYDRAMELVNVSQNSGGESAKQLRAYNQGLEASFTDLNNAWQEFATTLADSSMIKKVVDILTNLIEIVNELPDGMVQAVSYFKLFNMGVESFSQIGKKLQQGGIDLGAIFSFKTDGLKNFGTEVLNTFDDIKEKGDGTTRIVNKMTEGLEKMGIVSKSTATAQGELNAQRGGSIATTEAEASSLGKLSETLNIAGKGADILGNEVKEYTNVMGENDHILEKEADDVMTYTSSVGHNVFSGAAIEAEAQIAESDRQLQDLAEAKRLAKEQLYDEFSSQHKQKFGGLKGSRTKQLKSRKNSQGEQMALDLDFGNYKVADVETLVYGGSIPELSTAYRAMEEEFDRAESIILEGKKNAKELLKKNKEGIDAIKEYREEGKAYAEKKSKSSKRKKPEITDVPVSETETPKTKMTTSQEASRQFFTGGPKGQATNISEIGKIWSKQGATVDKVSGTYKELNKTINMSNIGMGMMASTLVGMGADFIGLEGPSKSFATTTAALLPTLGKFGLHGIAAAVAIGALKAGYDALYPSVEEVEKKLSELATKGDEIIQSHSDIENSLDVYSSLKDDLHKTSEEQERFNSAVQTLQNEVPGIVSGYDSMGNAIIEVGKATEALNNKQAALVENSKLRLKEFSRLQRAKGPNIWDYMIWTANIDDKKDARKSVLTENYGEIYGLLQDTIKDSVKEGSAENQAIRTEISNSILDIFMTEGIEKDLNLNNITKKVNDLFESLNYGDLDIIANISEGIENSTTFDNASWNKVKTEVERQLKEKFAHLDLSDEEFEILLKSTLKTTYEGSVDIEGVQKEIQSQIDTGDKSSDWIKNAKNFKKVIGELPADIAATMDSMGLLSAESSQIFANMGKGKIQQLFTDKDGKINKTKASSQLLGGALDKEEKSSLNLKSLEEEKRALKEFKEQYENRELKVDYSDEGRENVKKYRTINEEIRKIDGEIQKAKVETSAWGSQVQILMEAFQGVEVPSFGEIAEGLREEISALEKVDSLLDDIQDRSGNMSLDNIASMFEVLENFGADGSALKGTEEYANVIAGLNDSLTIENGQLKMNAEGMKVLAQAQQMATKAKYQDLLATLEKSTTEAEIQKQLIQVQLDAAKKALELKKQGVDADAAELQIKGQITTEMANLHITEKNQEAKTFNEMLANVSTFSQQYARIYAARLDPDQAGNVSYKLLDENAAKLDKNFAAESVQSIKALYEGPDGIANLENYIASLESQMAHLDKTVIEQNELKSKISGYLASDSTDLYGALTGGAQDAADSQSDYNEKLKETLTLIEKIQGLQHTISENESLKSLYEGYDGEAYGRILMSNLNLAKQEYEVQKQLFEMQQKITNQAAGDLLDSPYGQMFKISENGDIGWASEDTYAKYKGMTDDMQEDIDGLVEAYQAERDELRNVEKELTVYAEATKAAREEIVKMEIEVENELVAALKNRESIIHEARVKALDDEISMIDKAIEARQKARETEEDNEDLYEAQEALRRATLDSSGKNNSSLLQLQQDLEDKQLEISEKRFEDDMEDRKQWLQDTKDAETETYEYRLETMSWYWENVKEIQEMGQEAMMQTLIKWNEEYRTQSALQQDEMERKWTFTMDAMKKAADMGAELGKLTSGIQSSTAAVESMNIKVQALAGSWRAAASAASSYGGSSFGGGGGYASSSGGGSKQIHTDYYRGAINSDAAYGTFGAVDKNNIKYQPNNIGGVKLTSTGAKAGNVGIYKNSSGVVVKDQTVWKLRAGEYYIWNGTKNKYESAASLSKSPIVPGYSPVTGVLGNISGILKKGGFKYADGGIVDYTGPAWVDGTKSKPEAFLNPYQTEQIGALVQSLSGQNINSATANSNITFGSVNFNVASMSSSADGRKALEAFVQGANDMMSKKGIGTKLNLNTK